MIKIRLVVVLTVAETVLFAWLAPAVSRSDQPNILLILADDLGFSDLGCYGGEIATPNLDRLAENGIRFTQFYNTARCWPTRAALLTGYYAQQIRRDVVPDIPSGSRGQRPAWAPLLSQRLKPLGYRSYHSGKWHLDGMPVQNGFDRSYYLKDQGRYFSPRIHWEDDTKKPAVDAGSGFYGTIAIADHALKCLREHAEKHAKEPFFHFLAFTAPHFPLHALPEDIDRYRDTYRVGWDIIRRNRWNKLKAAGIVRGDLSRVEREIGPPYHFPAALETLGPGEVNRPLPWKTLADQQRDFQTVKMAIHAAMVDRVDREIGRVLDQLRAMEEFENTLILFLSDNGASAEIMVRDDGHDASAPPGSAATYLCLGPGWSTCCNTPFRRHKTWVHEGGIATPLIVHWPQGITDGGQLRRNPGHVIDIVPTVMELAGASGADSLREGTEKPDMAPVPPGKSLVLSFAKDAIVQRDYLWWLHEGNRALRVDDWKLVAAKGEPWELFNLNFDRAETTDLAALYPEKVLQLEKVWRQQFDKFRADASEDLPIQP